MLNRIKNFSFYSKLCRSLMPRKRAMPEIIKQTEAENGFNELSASGLDHYTG